MDEIRHENVDVTIVASRWSVRIDISKDSQLVQTYRASADAAYTWNDGIWFGTEPEYGKGPTI